MTQNVNRAHRPESLRSPEVLRRTIPLNCMLIVNHFCFYVKCVKYFGLIVKHCDLNPLRYDMCCQRWPPDNSSVLFVPQVSGSSAGSPAGSSAPSSSSRQYSRQRITRVNLRDFIFYMEQERETNRSLLLYRALLK